VSKHGFAMLTGPYKKESKRFVWILWYGPEWTRTNPTGEVETKKTTKGGTECAPVADESEQFAQLLQAFQALTPEARNALLHALEQGGAVKSLQGEDVDRRGEPRLRVSELNTFLLC